jgi:hypothetical protein
VHSRRHFLGLLLCGLFGSRLGALRAPAATAHARAVARLFPDPRSARRIGAEYVRAHPDADAASLVRSLEAAGLPVEHWTAEAVATRARRDFDEGRIVPVGGFLLSRAEAELCAFAFCAASSAG